MEHPYLFLVKLFEWLGLGHFAHEYPHVLYSWLVMVLLIISGSIAVKNLDIIPTKAQNFFEIIVEGLENFMVDITGEEGRWFFPVLCTVFLYIFTVRQIAACLRQS